MNIQIFISVFKQWINVFQYFVFIKSKKIEDIRKMMTVFGLNLIQRKWIRFYKLKIASDFE